MRLMWGDSMAKKSSGTETEKAVKRTRKKKEPLNGIVDIEKLRVNHVMGYNPISIEIKGEVIELDDGWQELVLLLLGYIQSNHTEDFILYLLKNRILSADFNVTSLPKKVLPNSNIMTYEINHSKIYLQTQLLADTVVNALKNMSRALGYKKEEVKLMLLKNAEWKVYIENKNKKLEKITEAYNIREAIQNYTDEFIVESVFIFGIKVEIGCLEDAITTVLNWAIQIYGANILNEIAPLNFGKTIGITKGKIAEDDTVIIRDIGKTKYKLYSLGYIKEALVYLGRICGEVGIESEEIEVEMSRLELV